MLMNLLLAISFTHVLNRDVHTRVAILFNDVIIIISAQEKFHARGLSATLFERLIQQTSRQSLKTFITLPRVVHVNVRWLLQLLGRT